MNDEMQFHPTELTPVAIVTYQGNRFYSKEIN